jgi:phage terminase large subunit
LSAVVQEIKTAHTTVYLPFKYDWKRPDYKAVYLYRARWLLDLRRNPDKLQRLLHWYKSNLAVAQFICDWGCTEDPRERAQGVPTLRPFILFPKQVEWIDWFLARWRVPEPGITEKSRDCGVTWLAMCTTNTLSMWMDGLRFIFGSAKADIVDRTDDPDSMFHKGRFFLQHLPWEFRNGWDPASDGSFMRITHRRTGSTLVGQSGDEIGRGGRSSAAFIDEAAHLPHPQMVDDALVSNTGCRIDFSSVAGMANPFAVKRHSGQISVFTFHWRDDPRKDQAWYEKIKRDTADPVAIARNVDIDYHASTEGQLIPSAWFQASVGACEKLGIEPTGVARGGFDVADEGRNQCAFAGRYGQELEYLVRWPGGNGGDIFKSVERVFGYCQAGEYEDFAYDADGMGASVRGDARIISAQRKREGLRYIKDYPFHGSGAVVDPEGLFRMGHGNEKSAASPKKNKDMFANLKAQSGYTLRCRFLATYRAVVEGLPYNVDDIISIAPDLPLLDALSLQMQQPTYSLTATGKIVIDKTPDGMPSPDLYDAVMIAYNPSKYALEAWSRLK